VRLSPLGTSATNRPIVPAPDNRWVRSSTPRIPVWLPLCPPQSPHDLTWFIQLTSHIPLTAYCQIYIRASNSSPSFEDGDCSVFRNVRKPSNCTRHIAKSRSHAFPDLFVSQQEAQSCLCDDIHEHGQRVLKTACYWLCHMYSVWVCSVLSAWFSSGDRLYKHRTSWRQTWLNCRYCRRAPAGRDAAIPIVTLPKVNDRLTPHKSSARETHGYDNTIRSFPDRSIELNMPINLLLSVSVIIKTRAARPQPSHSHKERVEYASLLPCFDRLVCWKKTICVFRTWSVGLRSGPLGDAGSVSALINRSSCDFDRPVGETPVGYDPARFACSAPAV
jgi:hypothetical protein